MGWPRLIELHDSQHSHSYNGSEVRETWYVEPYDAATAFIASMLGNVQADGTRTLPAQHYLYNWCFATQCDIVPLDPRSFSYMGRTKFTPIAPGGARLANTNKVRDAVGTYATAGAAKPVRYLRPTTDIDPAFRSQTNKDYSAGVFVTTTYEALLTPSPPADGVYPDSIMDAVRIRLDPEQRTNVINAGLRLIVPNAVFWYPSSGVAPIIKEEFQKLTIERRMLKPTFNRAELSKYVNSVNKVQETLPTGEVCREATLRFDSYASEFVQVPQVGDDGEPNGYCRWLNLAFRYDWRTLLSNVVHRFDDGTREDGFNPVTWNHILAYPGDISWLQGIIGGNDEGLGWYWSRYSARIFGVDSNAYPYVTDAVGNPVASLVMLDSPLTINP